MQELVPRVNSHAVLLKHTTDQWLRQRGVRATYEVSGVDRQEMQDLFELLDDRGRGWIDHTSLVKAAEAVLGPGNFRLNCLKQAITAMDLQRMGKVGMVGEGCSLGRPEFRAYMAVQWSSASKNAENVVGRSDTDEDMLTVDGRMRLVDMLKAYRRRLMVDLALKKAAAPRERAAEDNDSYSESASDAWQPVRRAAPSEHTPVVEIFLPPPGSPSAATSAQQQQQQLTVGADSPEASGASFSSGAKQGAGRKKRPPVGRVSMNHLAVEVERSNLSMFRPADLWHHMDEGSALPGDGSREKLPGSWSGMENFTGEDGVGRGRSKSSQQLQFDGSQVLPQVVRSRLGLGPAGVADGWSGDSLISPRESVTAASPPLKLPSLRSPGTNGGASESRWFEADRDGSEDALPVGGGNMLYRRSAPELAVNPADDGSHGVMSAIGSLLTKMTGIFGPGKAASQALPAVPAVPQAGDRGKRNGPSNLGAGSVRSASFYGEGSHRRSSTAFYGKPGPRVFPNQ